jgi:hypothetical protein
VGVGKSGDFESRHRVGLYVDVDMDDEHAGMNKPKARNSKHQA